MWCEEHFYGTIKLITDKHFAIHSRTQGVNADKVNMLMAIAVY